MANNYYERGDRLNVYLAAELPEEMTGTQDTRRICGNCAWYSFRKLESTCGKTGREVAYFATRECFTTEKDTTMEENTNAQPVAETGTQVCKECGRTLPLEDFQRRRNGKIDTVCKACRAEKIRVGMATGKEKKIKVDIPEKIAKAVSAPSPASEAALEEAVKTEGVEIAQLCRYIVEFRMAGLALWGMMPRKEEDIDHIIEAEWRISFCQEIFAAAAELKRDGANVVPALVAKRLGGVGQMFVEDLGNAFYPLAKECDTSEQKPAEWSVEYFDIILNQVYKAIRRTLASLAVYDEDEKLLESKEATLSYYSQQCSEAILETLRPSWKPAQEPVVILKTADFSDAALLEELRRRGYKGTITKVQEVEL